MSAAAMSKLGAVTPTTRAIVQEVLTELQRATGKTLTVCWGMGGPPEHSTGRAVDFMVFKDRAAGDWIANYIWNNRERFNLRHIIWYRRIRSTVVAPGKWRTMPDRGSSTQNHLDHPHVFFNPGTYSPPATVGVVGPRGPFPLPDGHFYGVPDGTARAHNGAVLRDRQGIKQIQAAVGAVRDGLYGPNTARAVMEYQSTHRLLRTGRVTKSDWLRM